MRRESCIRQCFWCDRRWPRWLSRGQGHRYRCCTWFRSLPGGRRDCGWQTGQYRQRLRTCELSKRQRGYRESRLAPPALCQIHWLPPSWEWSGSPRGCSSDHHHLKLKFDLDNLLENQRLTGQSFLDNEVSEKRLRTCVVQKYLVFDLRKELWKQYGYP